MATTLITNQTDFTGSLMYNINVMTGYMINANTDEAAHKYSDMIESIGTTGYEDYLTGIKDPTFTQHGGVTGPNTTYSHTMAQAEYETGDWFLMGKIWLPWFPPPSDGQGGYQKRSSWNGTTHTDTTILFNKARSDVLIPTAITTAKLIGIGVVGLFTTKYVLKGIYDES